MNTHSGQSGPVAQPGAGSLLDRARHARATAAERLRAVEVRQPAPSAGPQARVEWLRFKADVHDQVAGHLRGVGDVAGAVEAEVLASRCRMDAADLSTASATGRAAGTDVGIDVGATRRVAGFTGDASSAAGSGVEGSAVAGRWVWVRAGPPAHTQAQARGRASGLPPACDLAGGLRRAVTPGLDGHAADAAHVS